MPENNESIQGLRDKVFNGTSEQDDTISVIAQQKDADYFKYLYNGSSINQSYHKNIIKATQRILICSIIIFILVTVFICFLIGWMVIKNDVLTLEKSVPLISACFVDLLSVFIVFIIKQLMKSKDKYFDKNDESEKLTKIIGLIQSVKDDTSRNKLIDKMVSNYCSNLKK